MAQRLVRKLCEECKQEIDATPEVVKMLHESLDSLHGFDLHNDETNQKIHFDSRTENVKLFKAVGCPKCSDSGYQGRLGIFECMRASEKVGQMIVAQAAATEIQKQAIAEGMITMVQDGYMKALEGLTTVEEVLRVQNT